MPPTTRTITAPKMPKIIFLFFKKKNGVIQTSAVEMKANDKKITFTNSERWERVLVVRNREYVFEVENPSMITRVWSTLRSN